ncbi:Hypothetical protein PBC10988_6150 [Planctomycetales bacterium 10988]|nr:Hypothetical protein PBC10988_6150 [Planctomycetales bacterium 10988]
MVKPKSSFKKSMIYSRKSGVFVLGLSIGILTVISLAGFSETVAQTTEDSPVVKPPKFWALTPAEKSEAEESTSDNKTKPVLATEELPQPQQTQGPEPPGDPTTSPPELRGILEGDAQAARGTEIPSMSVAGRMVLSGGSAKAILLIGDRYVLASPGTRFLLGGGESALVKSIDENFVEVEFEQLGRSVRLP